MPPALQSGPNGVKLVPCGAEGGALGSLTDRCLESCAGKQILRLPSARPCSPHPLINWLLPRLQCLAMCPFLRLTELSAWSSRCDLVL